MAEALSPEEQDLVSFRSGLRRAFHVIGDRSPCDQRKDQTLGRGLQCAWAERQGRDLAGSLVDDDIEAGHPDEQLPAHRA